MIFKQLFDDKSSTYSYLIGDETTKEAAIVDPVLEQVESYIKLVQELDLKLFATLETHYHADHITGANKLKQAVRSTVFAPEYEGVTNADALLRDRDRLAVGPVQLRAISTPGHTSAHLCYLVDDQFVLTGDALLINGCGRTDFQEGDAGTLYDSVTEKLFTLPDEVQVYPGHDYNGETVSSIGAEKQNNPRFANQSRDSFIELMANLKLDKPKQIDTNLPANLALGAL